MGQDEYQNDLAEWIDSPDICGLADGERHLGHIVRAGDYWLAFDGTSLNDEKNGLRPLGLFPSITSAKEAVMQATRKRPFEKHLRAGDLLPPM